MNKRVLIIAGIGFALITALLFIVLFFIKVSAGTTVADLKVGDCIEDLYTTQTVDINGDDAEINTISCDEDHPQEVISVFEKAFATSSTAPLPGEVDEKVKELCIPNFEEKLGLQYHESGLLVTGLYPSDQAWEEGERRLTCLISNLNTSLFSERRLPSA